MKRILTGPVTRCPHRVGFFFFYNDPATTEFSPLPLHDALPILILTYGTLEEVFAHLDELPPRQRTNLGEAQDRLLVNREFFRFRTAQDLAREGVDTAVLDERSEEHTSELQSRLHLVCRLLLDKK